MKKIKYAATKILTCVMALVVLTFVACSNNIPQSNSEGAIPSQSELTLPATSSAPSSEASTPSSSSASSSEPSPAGGQEAPAQPRQLPAYSEQALKSCLAYLQQSLTDEQHGGIYRISDFNGSGLALHGGQDKANPYILIWAVDEAAIKRVIESYSGQKIEIVIARAIYTLHQLNSVISEIQNSEIATNINGMVLGEDNKVLLDVIGKNNQEKVKHFLQSYGNKAAVALFARSGDDENPST